MAVVSVLSSNAVRRGNESFSGWLDCNGYKHLPIRKKTDGDSEAELQIRLPCRPFLELSILDCVEYDN